ncbi:VOC family protein [Marinomonas algicola]|uniref:VOC family protein n=1 Tax=Marinomonas algicola TaxID=2773454 RepID=UPI00174B5313|nr:VOC family protein [Marinomonas algicola]
MDLSNFTILYVENVRRSIDFYLPLFEREPAQISDGFALFVSESGAKFGLWAKHDVTPKIQGRAAGAMEVVLEVSNVITLQINHTKWRELGVNIIQEPIELDFGTSFTAEDPDGHRLRVFCYEKS